MTTLRFRKRKTSSETIKTSCNLILCSLFCVPLKTMSVFLFTSLNITIGVKRLLYSIRDKYNFCFQFFSPFLNLDGDTSYVRKPLFSIFCLLGYRQDFRIDSIGRRNENQFVYKIVI